jgi:positive regulator of sigma E activity
MLTYAGSRLSFPIPTHLSSSPARELAGGQVVPETLALDPGAALLIAALLLLCAALLLLYCQVVPETLALDPGAVLVIAALLLLCAALLLLYYSRELAGRRVVPETLALDPAAVQSDDLLPTLSAYADVG